MRERERGDMSNGEREERERRKGVIERDRRGRDRASDRQRERRGVREESSL